MFDFQSGMKVKPAQDDKAIADMFTVRFDFLPSLKSGSMAISANYFDDDGCSYVKELIATQSDKPEPSAIPVPPYLAAVDLRNYLITLFPNAISIQPRNRLA